MGHRAHQAVQTYFDALMQYDLKEADVSNFVRKGHVMIINTPNKAYFKSITPNGKNVYPQAQDATY